MALPGGMDRSTQQMCRWSKEPPSRRGPCMMTRNLPRRSVISIAIVQFTNPQPCGDGFGQERTFTLPSPSGEGIEGWGRAPKGKSSI